MPSTLHYYNSHAAEFFAGTVAVDMRALHNRFLTSIPSGGYVLDAGCGSGRDSKAFLAQGYRVFAFDASPELAAMATDLIGQLVHCRSFAQVNELACYDGIWACASLLHLTADAIPAALEQLWAALKPGGVFYLSFKLGDGEREHNGRHFTDATEARLRDWVNALPDVAALECWVTEDQRPDRAEHWINGLICRSATPPAKLITGGNDQPFLLQLCASIAHADEIDFTVAFIKTSGLRLLLPDLQSALTRGAAVASTKPNARIRILTSDYLDVTDPDALRLLQLLQEHGAQVRVFEAASCSFHMKAYLFARVTDNHQLQGTAFIGSSNISRQALTTGLEWNYRVDYPAEVGFVEARNRFESVFCDPRTQTLSDSWIASYEARRMPSTFAVAPGSNEKESIPIPTPIQSEALQALAKTRVCGYRRGLVVLATGLGKTWLAAFDAQQMGASRVLFVAHREEILQQAATTFLRIRPSGRVGYYMGKVRDTQVDVLCASIQTLGRSAHLARFAPDHFDYIVIDEFHHAAAPTYRALLQYFTPQFLIGLTATPDRTDQSNILSLCDDNHVYTCELFSGISAGLLAPFHYYGIWDESVDYQQIPWRNGRFDPDELSNKLATLARARHALAQWREKGQRRTLAFCVSVRHADFMADQFKKNGIAAAAVHSTSDLSRGDALAQLSDGRLQVVFSVDLFSEGLDLPAIDTVLMLRPTESKILFLQQLGRGLRLAPDKDKLVVLDFIGNHHSFLHKPQALAKTGSSYHELVKHARQVAAQQLLLPNGCFVSYDLALIDFLKGLGHGFAEQDFKALQDVLGRRPTLAEYYRSGADVLRIRQKYGHWFAFVGAMDALTDSEVTGAMAFQAFLREIEVRAMTRSYTMVLLEAFQELDGWRTTPMLADLAQRSWQVLQRRRPLLADLPVTIADTKDGKSNIWLAYWRKNPITAWVGGRLQSTTPKFFKINGDRFLPTFNVAEHDRETLAALVQELIDYRLASYQDRQTTAPVLGTDEQPTTSTTRGNNVIPFPSKRVQLPYFPDLKIACGHFRSASTEVTEYCSLGEDFGRLDPARHFIARAIGNSMNGGKNPVCDGDYLLLELINPSKAGSITGSVMAIEQQDASGDNQYLLRNVLKSLEGGYILRASNLAYPDMRATDAMRTLARLKAIIDPSDLSEVEV